MTGPAGAQSSAGPYPHLLKSRDLGLLWLTRILVHLGCIGHLADPMRAHLAGRLMEKLGLDGTVLADPGQRAAFAGRICATLAAMERRRGAYRHKRPLYGNLALIGRQLGLSAVERRLFALAALLRSDDLLYELAGATDKLIDTPRALSRVTGDSEEKIGRATTAASLLRRAGLVEAGSGGSLRDVLRVQRGGLRRLATQRLACADELFPGYLRQSPPPNLPAGAYRHMGLRFALARRLLQEAAHSRRTGVNVLIHGQPGTGKTQLARVIAAALAIPLYEVSAVDDAGDPATPAFRLERAAVCQALLAGRKALLVFDECDTVFDSEQPSSGTTAANSVKAWLNGLLESNAVPTFWIANRIGNMDPAFVRRFDLVLRLDPPSMRHRLDLLESACGGGVAPERLRRLAGIDAATPAVLARAAGVMRRLPAGGENAADILDCLLEGTLTAQGHPPLRALCPGPPDGDYEIRLCNAGCDLEALAAGLARTGQGRILLHGPPGTGKTAFGQWLSDRLDRPLLRRRVSDIQSKFLGEAEHRLAAAFDAAMRSGAILQMDEIDGFVQDRRHARHAWETTQVNELLMQLESYAGIFVATTNMPDSLDPAALRRFDFKIRLDYLSAGQAWDIMRRKLSEWGIPVWDEASLRGNLSALSALTPGDFSTLARRHAIAPFPSASAVFDALREEAALKGAGKAKAGFV